MQIPSLKNNIKYQLLDDSYFEEVSNLFADRFINQELLIKNSGVLYENYILATRVRTQHAIDNKMSIVAICQETQKIAGFCINLDPYSSSQVDRSSYADRDPAFKLINQTLTELYKNIKLTEKAGVNFSIYALAVAQDFQNLGIATTLIKLSEQIALDNNFSKIFIDATSLGTYKIAQKLGYNQLAQISYQDFNYGGNKPFKDITDYIGPTVFIKALK